MPTGNQFAPEEVGSMEDAPDIRESFERSADMAEKIETAETETREVASNDEEAPLASEPSNETEGNPGDLMQQIRNMQSQELFRKQLSRYNSGREKKEPIRRLRLRDKRSEETKRRLLEEAEAKRERKRQRNLRNLNK